jgi:hypothetical protein
MSVRIGGTPEFSEAPGAVISFMAFDDKSGGASPCSYKLAFSGVWAGGGNDW